MRRAHLNEHSQMNTSKEEAKISSTVKVTMSNARSAGSTERARMGENEGMRKRYMKSTSFLVASPRHPKRNPKNWNLHLLVISLINQPRVLIHLFMGTKGHREKRDSTKILRG